MPPTVTIVVPPDDPQDESPDIVEPPSDIVESLIREQTDSLTAEEPLLEVDARPVGFADLPQVPERDRRQQVPADQPASFNPFPSRKPRVPQGQSPTEKLGATPKEVSPPRDTVAEVVRRAVEKKVVAAPNAERAVVRSPPDEAIDMRRRDPSDSGDGQGTGESGVRRSVRRRAMPEIADSDPPGGRSRQVERFADVPTESPIENFLRSFDHVPDPPGFTQLAEFTDDRL